MDVSIESVRYKKMFEKGDFFGAIFQTFLTIGGQIASLLISKVVFALKCDLVHESMLASTPPTWTSTILS